MKKRVIVSLSVVIALTVLVNAAAAVFIRKVVGDDLDRSHQGYAERSYEMIHPEFEAVNDKENNSARARFYMRSLLDDARIRNHNSFLYNFLFLNMDVDVSIVMYDKDGMNEFSKGIFAAVADEDMDLGDKKIDMLKTVGMIDVREFAKADCADEVKKLLDEDFTRRIRIDEYSEENHMIKPAKITVLEKDGGEVRSFDIPCEGETKTADSYYINLPDSMVDEVNEMSGKLEDARLGERSADKKALALATQDIFEGGDKSEVKRSYGFGGYTTKMREVNGDNAMVTVIHHSYMKGSLLYLAVFAVPAVLVIIFGGSKKNKF